MKRLFTFKLGARRVILIAAVAAITLVLLVPMIGASAAGATVGQPFSCPSELDFLSQGIPETQLFEGVAGGGSVTYTPLGPPQPVTYNALGYDPLNNYLYATNIYLPPSSLGEPGALEKIDNTGHATSLGPIAGYPVAFKAPADGAFDGSGHYWITNGKGSNIAYEIEVEGSPHVVSEVPLSQPWQPIDFTFYEGFMWGLSGETVYRLELATGVVSTFPAPSGIVPGELGFGAAWTTANGNLGFSDNETGQVYKISVTNPSGTPTFKVVAEYSGPVAGESNDGAACIPTEAVDLAVTKAGPATVAPGGTVSWTLTAENNGPGNSSGFSISDEVPSGYTNVTTSTPGCVMKGNEVLCSEGALANGATFTATISATAPASTGTCLTNTASVIGNERDPEPANNAASVQTCTGEAKPVVKAAITCTSVTFFFKGFPNAPNNTVIERVLVDGVRIYRGTFTFNGPEASNTVAISVPPDHHKVVAVARWNTNGVNGEKDMPKPGGITCPPHVYVGYADSNHLEQNAHPVPWQGEPEVIFEGCGYGGSDDCPTSEGEDVYDAGAIRIDAPASQGLTVTGASVQIGPCSYSPWPGLNVSVPAKGILILTQTGKHKCTETNTSEQDNFDTSQSFLKSPQYTEFQKTGKCSNDGYIPAITLTVNGKTTTLNDAGQVLNGGGIDPDLCNKVNEAVNWVQIQ